MLPSVVLSPALGARLERVDVQWHLIDGHPESLMRFWLTFDGRTFGFHVGAETEGLDVLLERVGVNADLGRYGRLEVRPTRPPDPTAAAVGQRLVGVEDLFLGYCQSPQSGVPQPVSARPAGAMLRFEAAQVAVADYDEELHWGDDRLVAGLGLAAR